MNHWLLDGVVHLLMLERAEFKDFGDNFLVGNFMLKFNELIDWLWAKETSFADEDSNSSS